MAINDRSGTDYFAHKKIPLSREQSKNSCVVQIISLNIFCVSII